MKSSVRRLSGRLTAAARAVASACAGDGRDSRPPRQTQRLAFTSAPVSSREFSTSKSPSEPSGARAESSPSTTQRCRSRARAPSLSDVRGCERAPADADAVADADAEADAAADADGVGNAPPNRRQRPLRRVGLDDLVTAPTSLPTQRSSSMRDRLLRRPLPGTSFSYSLGK